MVTIKSHTFFSAPLLSTPSSHWWSKIIQKIPTAWSFPNIVLGLLISLSKKWEMNICHKGFFMLRHFFVTKQLINGLVSLFLMDFRWEQTPKKLRHKSVTLLRSPGVQHPLILTHWNWEIIFFESLLVDLRQKLFFAWFPSRIGKLSENPDFSSHEFASIFLLFQFFVSILTYFWPSLKRKRRLYLHFITKP